MKATMLIAALSTALWWAIGAGSATADPDLSIYPVPYMEHDGTYVVGKDIKPGLYVSDGGAGGGVCAWTLSPPGSGGGASVVNHGESNGAQYALISAGDKTFQTHGCQPWNIGTRPPRLVEPVPRTCTYPLTGCQDPDAQKPSP